MTDDSSFYSEPGARSSHHRLDNLERQLTELEKRHARLRDRVRDAEEHIRKVEAECKEWGPIIDAARDQEYLRRWIERQEHRESQRREWRWGHVAVVVAAVGVVMGAINAVVVIVLHAAGHG